MAKNYSNTNNSNKNANNSSYSSYADTQSKNKNSNKNSTGVLQLNKSKIPCRPHKVCIFLSNFMFFSVLVCNSVL